MIKSIRFKNFFSFRDCKVELNNLNALIGINGSGKSNFIKAINLLKATIREGALPNLILNQWGGFDSMYFAGNNDVEKVIELEFEFDEKLLKGFSTSVYYYIAFSKAGASQNYSLSECFHTNDDNGNWDKKYFYMNSGVGSLSDGTKDVPKQLNAPTVNSESILSQGVDESVYLQIHTLRESIKNISAYNNFDTSANSAIRKPMLSTGVSARLNPDGGNLTSILNRIKINSKTNYNKIVDSLQTINPQYNGFDFNFIGGNIELMLDEKGFDKSIHVTHISDGTLRFLCLLAIVHNPERGGLVCIDEPENGLHPDMIMDVVEAIKDTTDKTQFIIATHSDHILNNLSVENVLVCEKDDDNATIINTFRDKDYVEWASQYSTGRLWRNGHLGGNRY